MASEATVSCTRAISSSDVPSKWLNRESGVCRAASVTAILSNCIVLILLSKVRKDSCEEKVRVARIVVRPDRILG